MMYEGSSVPTSSPVLFVLLNVDILVSMMQRLVVFILLLLFLGCVRMHVLPGIEPRV